MSSFKKIMALFLLALGATLVVGGYLLFHDQTPPTVSLSPQLRTISPGQKFVLTLEDTASPIRSVTVSIRKNSQKQTIASHVFPDKANKQTFAFQMQESILRDGAFILVVNAIDHSFAGFGMGNSITHEFPLFWESTPPRVTYKTSQPHLRRGGSGSIVYTLSREVKETGVRVGDHFFPAFLQANGDYVCFFAFPFHVLTQDYTPELVITDHADNMYTSKVPLTKAPTQFKNDVIRITDRFLDTKMPYFEQEIPGTASRLALFNKVNGELRRANAARLVELGKKTNPAALWDNVFMTLPKSAVMAGFGEHRVYEYNGERLPVTATHLGLDLASVAKAPVPAGNAGIVVFAGSLGIYGNLVVLDHGLGLQSLYSHLTDIQVTEGQEVARGQIVGTTGTTGMAVGDHVHFGILVSGVEVAPVEWLDHNWIRNNITDRLKEAGASIPEFKAKAAPEPQPAASVAPAQKKQSETRAKKRR